MAEFLEQARSTTAAVRMLHFERERLTSLFLQAPMPVAVLKGPDFFYELSNHANQQLLNHQPVIGKAARDVPGVSLEFLRLLQKVYNGSEAAVAKALPIHYARNGVLEMRYIDFTFSPIADDLGAVESILVTGNDVTETIVAKNRAQSKEAEYKNLLDSIPQIVWTIKPGDEGVYNRKWWEYTGLDPAMFQAQDAANAIHPEDRGRLIKSIRRALRKGKSLEEEFRIRSAAGEYRWHLGRLLPIRASDGTVTQHYGTATDTEDKKRKELEYRALTEEVYRREAQFRLLANAMPQMVWIADGEGRALYFNSKWYDYSGLSAEQSLVHEWTKTLHPDDIEDTARAWKQALVTEEDLEIECRFRGADGNYRWFLDRAYPVRDSSGKVTRWFGTSTDINDLIEAQSRFRAFFAQSSLPMEIYSLDGTLLALNQAWEKLFDTKFEELSGYNLLTDPQTEALGIIPLLQRAIAGEAVEVPAIYYDPAKAGKGGRGRWIEASYFPVKDRNGSVRELAIILRDVTDRRNTEDKLKESNEELERAVRARQDLLNICGHELKTPLCSLRLQAQTAKRRIVEGGGSAFEPRRVEKLIDIFDRQIDRLVHLVDDMLDLTRITSGRLHLSREWVALPQLALEVIDRFSDQLALAGCHVSTSLSPDINGYWDRFRVEQVLNNLLTNAVKYGKGAPIALSAEKSGDGKWAILSIRDQGMGISPENHERIFNRFERAISANEVSGLGLGLFITREIVNMHGGSIRVESELGQGSEFVVQLPLEAV